MAARNAFEAEILILDPADVPDAVEALAAVGCEFAIDHDAIDPFGPTVFGKVTGTTELGDNAVFDWLQAIVEPLDGDVIECGLVRAFPPAS
jgi:hypothetical protein